MSAPPKPKAAPVGAQTDHGGVVTGPGVATVLIEGRPAGVAGDPSAATHSCPVPPSPAHVPGPFTPGSSGVLIGGRPALRTGDKAPCGAGIVAGAATVEIGDRP